MKTVILSNPWSILAIIVVIAVLVVGILFIALPYAIKKGYPIGDWLTETKSVTESAKKVVSLVATTGLINSTPEVQILNIIIDTAEKATVAAEQVFSAGTIDAEGRKAYAEQYILDALAYIKIPVTPAITNLIDKAVEYGVGKLPSTLTAVGITPPGITVTSPIVLPLGTTVTVPEAPISNPVIDPAVVAGLTVNTVNTDSASSTIPTNTPSATTV